MAFLGPKGAGKTTAMCALAAGPSPCRLMSNDRTFVERDESLRMSYFPLIYRIGVGTLYSLPRLLERISSEYAERNPTKGKVLVAREATHRKFSIDPRGFADLFGRELLSSCSLGTVVLLRNDEESGKGWWRTPTAAAAREELLAGCLTLHEDLFLDHWLLEPALTEAEFGRGAARTVDAILDRCALVEVGCPRTLEPERRAALIWEAVSAARALRRRGTNQD